MPTAEVSGPSSASQKVLDREIDPVVDLVARRAMPGRVR